MDHDVLESNRHLQPSMNMLLSAEVFLDDPRAISDAAGAHAGLSLCAVCA